MTNLIFQPWQLLVETIVGAVNQEQQRAIEHLRGVVSRAKIAFQRSRKV